jgi:uncharacterized MAPEG superfamily protein
MTADLTLLVWAVILTIVQLLVALLGAMTQFSLPALVGNREPACEGRGWVGRAQRAHRNMLENLPLFAILVLVAHAAGKENATTLLGAQLFLYARAAYAVIYYAGIPWLRTVAWGVSVLGMVLILLQLV